jgi:hypothetical protein
MSSITPHFSFYLPAIGDGDVNAQPWGIPVNNNFTWIDAELFD